MNSVLACGQLKFCVSIFCHTARVALQSQCFTTCQSDFLTLDWLMMLMMSSNYGGLETHKFRLILVSEFISLYSPLTSFASPTRGEIGGEYLPGFLRESFSVARSFVGLSEMRRTEPFHGEFSRNDEIPFENSTEAAFVGRSSSAWTLQYSFASLKSV